MSFETLRWDNPEAAWGFVFVAALAAGYALLGWWRRRVRRRAGDPAMIEQMAASVSRPRQRARAALLVVATALVVLALMRPKYGVREGAVTNAGIDIAIALDVSKSMLVRDVVPDRLTGAKLEINALLERLHGGRVALVPFAGIPFVQCPLTSDFEVVRAYLEDLSPSDMPVPGTAVARALKQALAVLTADDVDDTAEAQGLKVEQFKGSRHRAILLFTDGEDHEGEVAEVAQQIADAGVRVFTIGVGSGAGNVIPILADDGTEIGYMKMADGKTPLISGLNEALLREVAKTTEGAYLHFAQRSVVPELYAEIDKLEKREFEARFAKLGEDRFQLPLVVALFLLLLEWGLGDRRRQRGAAGGAVGGAVASLAPLLALGLALPSGPALAQADAEGARQPWHVTSNRDVDDGNVALERGEASAALEAYERARASVPENPVLHFNFGLAYAAAGQHERAVEAFGRALDGATAELEREARYAQATAYAMWATALEKSGGEDGERQALDKWKSAAGIYEQLLVQDPDLDDAKWNLELALLRVDPPCSKRNDDFEPNDTPEQATPIELSEDAQKGRLEAKQPVRLCPGDVDWFGVPLSAGDRVKVQVKITTPDVEIGEGEPAPALRLYDGQGASLADTPLPAEVAERRVEADGPLAIELVNPTEDELDVQLVVQVRPPCERFEDEHEDNDTPATAATVPQNESTPLRICPGDDDWFRATLGEGDSLFAFANAEGDYTEGFDLSITDAAGRPLARSAANQGARVAALLEPGAGTYLIRVTAGGTAEAPYTLTWKVLPPCPEGNDPLEPNDTPEEAKGLEDIAKAAATMPAVAPQAGAPGTAPAGPAQGEAPQQVTALLRICEGDVDYLRVPSIPDEPKIATILFDHDKGDLSLELLDEDGEDVLQRSDQSAPGRSAEAVGLPKVEEETDFLLRVQGVGGAENFYVLQLTSPPPPSDGDSSSDSDDDDQDDDDEQDEQDEQDRDDQQDRDEQEEQPQDRDAIEDELEQMDRNPQNLEAREALRQSPLRNVQPEKDW